MEKNYAEIFENLVQGTQDYIVGNNLNCMVIGISGGIDSTVVAAICHEVSKRINIPLIGRSLPTNHNKAGEVNSADLVGKAFCNDYKEVNIQKWYYESWSFNEHGSDYSTIAAGNIQARLRMIYLYNLASIHGGLVMDTDNLTENNLGYFTIHGDVGDFNPIGGLWKTEVFELAEWLVNYYSQSTYRPKNIPSENLYAAMRFEETDQSVAIKESLKLKPTAGLGITNNDLEEIGAESYNQVDTILQRLVSWRSRERDMFQTISEQYKCFLEEHNIQGIPSKIIEAVATRHFRSEFKRKHLPIKL